MTDYLDRQADLSGADAITTKEPKGRHVYERLTAVARESQSPVIAALDAVGAEHRSFWVTNAIVARGGLAAVEAVARLSAVEHVYPVGVGRLEPPVPVNVPGGTTSTNLTATVFDSIAQGQRRRRLGARLPRSGSRRRGRRHRRSLNARGAPGPLPRLERDDRQP